MLEVIALLVVVALVAVAKLLHNVVIELRNIQNLICSVVEEPDQEQLVQQDISRMLDADIELQRRKFWNGH